ncbi:uncharacterized protein LOC125959484 [Anopheles darlingi]|uniref:uncharacterized protein LOC125959484 n=1 Tax=Anopheles darlingi TaxID=43151 RepID=UPI00210053A8|nr:uncharacterized protein LOC125959484 [Anopheles darlingi]
MTDINRAKQGAYPHKHNGQIEPQSVQSPAGMPGSSVAAGSGGSLKRNNSHHQRSKKGGSSGHGTLERATVTTEQQRYGSVTATEPPTVEYVAHHQPPGATHGPTVRSGTGSGLAKSWSKQSSSSQSTQGGSGCSGTGLPTAAPVVLGATKLIPATNGLKTEATLADDFKRFHTLRSSYTAGGIGGGVSGGGGKSNLNVNNADQTIKSQVLLHQQKLREYSKQQQQQHQQPTASAAAAHRDNDSYSTCSSSQSDYQPQHPHQHAHYRMHHNHQHHQPARHHHQHHHHQQQQQHNNGQGPVALQQQHQQQPLSMYPVSATVAATATLTRAGGFGGGGGVGNDSTRNTLKRGPGGLSTLSLCSCDADTEIIPNPLRPLYQYSLDRKNPRQHTYTCEQNAQILLRLERDRQKKFGSMGKLHLATSTGDLSVAPTSSTVQRHSSITGGASASIPPAATSSSVSTPTPTPPPPGPMVGGAPPSSKAGTMGCKAVSVLSFDCQRAPYARGDNYAEDDSYSEDMIPPPPPPLNRRPSYGYGCIVPPVAGLPSTDPSTVGPDLPLHDLTMATGTTLHNAGSTGPPNNAGYNTGINAPDLFNFASVNGPVAGNSAGTLKSTLKSTKPSANSKATSGGPTVATATKGNKSKLNEPLLPVMMVDLMNGNGGPGTPGPLAPSSGGDAVEPSMTSAKPYPPYYFDDNYLHHHHHHQYHFYPPGATGDDRFGELSSDLPLKEPMADGGVGGQLYLYHQHPHNHHHLHQQQQQQHVTGLHGEPRGLGGGYIPNYDALSLPAKYNTIGANGHLPGELPPFSAHHYAGGGGAGMAGLGGLADHHASSCNINQYAAGGPAKTNLNHHFSNSISNFNFDPSSYFGSALDPAPGTTIIPGGLGGVMGPGDGFPSSCSLNGTPNKQHQQQQHPWKHRQCPSRGSSSTGSGSSKWDLPSRQWLAVTSILLIAGAAGVAVPLALKVSSGAPLEERLQVATQLLDTVPLIDGHNDLPWNIRKFLHNQLNDFRFDDDLKSILPWSKSAWSHTDLQRLKRGRISSQFWAAYVPCEAQHKDAVQITLEQIDVIKRLTERYSPHLTSCASVFDIVQAHKNRQMCSLIGVEGGHSLGGSLGVLRIYYALGVRYMTLTSTCHTPWADSSNADAPKYDVRHGGLTAYGKTIVREMNRLGMIVDLSKSSVSTMKDVLATSQAPVIFSHSSAHALCNSSRNVQDEVLELVTKNRGLVMVNFYNKFLRCSENASVQDAVAHINHIRKVAGIDHVGLGAGYDGINFTPRDLEDVASYPRLFAELLGDGWTVDELEKLAGRNLLRVFEEVEKVRENQRLSGVRPYEDIPPALRPDEHHNCSTNS